MITDNLEIELYNRAWRLWLYRAPKHMRKAYFWTLAIGPIYITAYPPLEK